MLPKFYAVANSKLKWQINILPYFESAKYNNYFLDGKFDRMVSNYFNQFFMCKM